MCHIACTQCRALHFLVYPEASSEWLTAMYGGVNSLVFALFGGKAYAIFALLFGFTFYVQYENQRLRGRDFGYRFLWRLVGLALLATIDAAFFPGGDLLLLYAVVGVVLFVVQLRCSVWWSRRYGQGPLERLWHKWTWLGA